MTRLYVDRDGIQVELISLAKMREPGDVAVFVPVTSYLFDDLQVLPRAEFDARFSAVRSSVPGLDIYGLLHADMSRHGAAHYADIIETRVLAMLRELGHAG